MDALSRLGIASTIAGTNESNGISKTYKLAKFMKNAKRALQPGKKKPLEVPRKNNLDKWELTNATYISTREECQNHSHPSSF